MNRCTLTNHFFHRCARWALASLGLAFALLWVAPPVKAQVEPGLGLVRPFPDLALRGTLTILGGSQATLNGAPVRMAPGMRLFSPQNNLVMLHNVTGQAFTVNYLIENSTGMLISAWILTQGEAALPRKAANGGGNTVTHTNLITLGSEGSVR